MEGIKYKCPVCSARLGDNIDQFYDLTKTLRETSPPGGLVANIVKSGNSDVKDDVCITCLLMMMNESPEKIDETLSHLSPEFRKFFGEISCVALSFAKDQKDSFSPLLKSTVDDVVKVYSSITKATGTDENEVFANDNEKRDCYQLFGSLRPILDTWVLNTVKQMGTCPGCAGHLPLPGPANVDQQDNDQDVDEAVNEVLQVKNIDEKTN